MSSRPVIQQTDPHASTHIERHVWVISGVLILGMIMSILDTTIVNVALHTLSHDLHSPLSQVQWVITGYLLALAAVIPVTGWAARRFGAKQVYMTSLVLFTAGSALCGLANSTTSLVVFRVLQGAGGGMIMPVAMMIMAQVAGPQRMGRVMGYVSMPAMLAPILGPVVGGLILENLHWSWIFFVNVPIGIVAFVLGWRMLPHTDSGEAGRLDVLGLALLPAGFAAFIYGISELGSGEAFGSGKVIVPSIVGVVLIVLFCIHALRIERPLLDIRMYANRVFAGAAFVNFGLGAALFGAMILVPLYYQEVRGQSVVNTGLLTGPQGLGALMAMPLASRLTQRFSGGRVALGGVSLLCVSTIPFTFIGAHTSIVAISLVLVVRGLSIGLCFMPAMTAAFGAMRPEQISDATPQINALQRTGGAIGTAVLAVVLQRAGAHAVTPADQASAFDTAYWWALGIAALSLIPCHHAAAGRAPPGRGRVARGAPRRVLERPARSRRPSGPERPHRHGARTTEPSSATVASSAEGPAQAEGSTGGGVARPSWSSSARPSDMCFAALRRLRGRDTHLIGSEVSHAQMELLIELSEQGPLSAGELALAAQLTPATVTHDARPPRRQCGHVQRTRGADDRRVVVTRLTPQGERKAKASVPRGRRAGEQALRRRGCRGLASRHTGPRALGNGLRRDAPPDGLECARPLR